MGTKKFKISHQRDKCIGCGSCAMYAPHCWKMNQEDGKADLVGGTQKRDVVVADYDIDELEANKKAAKACPMQIIRINKE